MAKMLYQGHGSFRLTSDDGRVIYVDPFAGEGYDVPADIILVSHQHNDHNQIHLCAQKPDCIIISNEDAMVDGKHCDFNIDGITIQATEAYNKNHDPKQCVGFIIGIDEVKIYASGDTSRTSHMERFANLEIDYAILCGDGVYNMGLSEAAECARLIKARNNILIHLKPGELFDRSLASQWDVSNQIIVEPGDEFSL